MKKLALILTICLLSLSLVGCNTPDSTPKDTPDVSDTSSTSSSEVEITSEEAEAPSATDLPKTTEPIMIADVAMYRGTVESIEKDGDEHRILIVAQEKGTQYGPPKMEVHVYDDTQLNFDFDELQVGQYIEFYYSSLVITEGMEAAEALAINHLGLAEMRVFNGTIKEINWENDTKGSMLVESVDDKGDMLFHFEDDGTTQFYLDAKSLEEGSEISIFHNPAVAASMPPQTTALEIRPYYAEQ